MPTWLEIRVVDYIYMGGARPTSVMWSHYAVWQDNSDLQKGCAGCILYCCWVVLATRPSPNNI